MSKVLVYILDKIVWMVLIVVLTTQILQMAGIIETPKSSQGFAYSKSNECNIQLSVGYDVRKNCGIVERSELIDSSFHKQFLQGDFFYFMNKNEIIQAVL
ncbi:uncharacterized protein LOC130441622 [Diorhabda sublineata]|uniref:uncharacterized protein LOC130441622 n=1 Tax=Diorhabda sublineata TaxID=1163346 RepID=UPI0024E0DA53|nr:uncharacterized protein LOC130441622 [Diorhabda sublineata]